MHGRDDRYPIVDVEGIQGPGRLPLGNMRHGLPELSRRHLASHLDSRRCPPPYRDVHGRRYR